MREFTTTGSCVPEEHYMVNTVEKLKEIKNLIDKRKYFTINRARQYGKTTTLHLLTKELSKDYMCLFMSFENAGQTMFESVADFCQRFLWQIEMIMEDFYPEQLGLWQDESINDFDLLGRHLNKLCKAKKIVLIIDEIDRASNYRVFLMFLSMLRDKYLDRNRGVAGKSFNLGNPIINLGNMFGYFISKDDSVVISNRIFEKLMYEYFISKDETNRDSGKVVDIIKEDIVMNGHFNMQLCLEKFAKHYYEIYSEHDIEFLERHGRLLFLTYLKPLINGHGFYYIESETRNIKRMDVIIDYDKEQFIIELKIWRGDSAHQKAYEQIISYMDGKGVSVGYLLTFDFRRDFNRMRKSEWITVGDKRIFDVIV